MDWSTLTINVPQADLTPVSGSLYSQDTNAYRQVLKGIEASEEGMAFPDCHSHNATYTVVGVTYARKFTIEFPYSHEYEDGQYTVLLTGSNNNLFDVEGGVLVRNQVSIIPSNSAGLIEKDIPERPTEAHLSVAYDGSNIEMGIWLVRLGQTVSNPTAATVNWYKSDGSLLFTDNDTGPDANGQFEIKRAQALDADEAYYVDVIISDAQGVVTTRRGVTTVATV